MIDFKEPEPEKVQKIIEELSEFNPNSKKRKRIPTTRNLKKLKTNKRDERLMPDGKPRYVRCYDNGGRTADRYTVVFTSRIEDEAGNRFYLGMSERPTHPQGFCSMNVAEGFVDRPSYIHLGKRIKFDALPTLCQFVVIDAYKSFWRLHKEDGDL